MPKIIEGKLNAEGKKFAIVRAAIMISSLKNSSAALWTP